MATTKNNNRKAPAKIDSAGNLLNGTSTSVGDLPVSWVPNCHVTSNPDKQNTSVFGHYTRKVFRDFVAVTLNPGSDLIEIAQAIGDLEQEMQTLDKTGLRYKTLDRKKRKLKEENLPCYVLGGVFGNDERLPKTGERQHVLEAHSGLMCLDLDHLDTDTIEDVQREVHDAYGALFTSKSVSGAGLRVVLLTDQLASSIEDYAKRHKSAVARFKQQELPYAADLDDLSDVTRLWFIAPDTSALSNPDAHAIDFSIDTTLLEGTSKKSKTTTKSKTPQSGRELCDLIRGITGDRHPKLNPLIFGFFANGGDVDDAGLREDIIQAVVSLGKDRSTAEKEVDSAIHDGHAKRIAYLEAHAEDTPCVIDHRDTDAHTRQNTVVKMLEKRIDEWLRLDRAWCYYDHTTGLWIECAERPEFPKVVTDWCRRELDICPTCSSYAETRLIALKMDREFGHRGRKGLILFRLKDGIYVVDVRNGYAVRRPERDDYLIADNYIHADGVGNRLNLTVEDIQDPRPPESHRLKSLVCMGEWKWSNEEYRFLNGYVAAGLAGLVSDLIVYLIAPTRSGKGTILQTVRRAVGDYGVTMKSSKLPENRFHTRKLVGKGVAIFDEGLTTKTLDTLNELTTGEGGIAAERKFGDEFDFYYGGSFFCAWTELPVFNRDRGSEGRAIFLNTEHAVGHLEKQPQHATKTVRDSAKPFLLEVLHYAKTRLSKNNDQPFDIPDSLIEYTRERIDSNDDVMQYIQNRYEEQQGEDVTRNDISKDVSDGVYHGRVSRMRTIHTKVDAALKRLRYKSEKEHRTAPVIVKNIRRLSPLDDSSEMDEQPF